MSYCRIRICLLLLICFLPLSGSGQETELVGLIEPYRIVNVGSPQIGVLAKVTLDRGDSAKVGEVLATLQSEVEEAALEVSRYKSQMESGIKAKEANMELAERKKTRSGQLYGDNLIPYSDMDESETTKLLAEMQLRDAQENKKLAEFEYKQNLEAVRRMTIRSPVNGIVMERFHHPGERIENEAILKIAQLNPLNVEMILPTALYHSIKVGMRAQIIPEAPIGGKYTAIVKIVDRVLDAASGTFGVRLELPNPDNRLPAGIKCKVIFPSRLLKKNGKNATDSTD
jgi:RND family efflux transporter MFP subunit